MAYDTNSLNGEPRMGEGEGGAGAGKTASQWVYRSADAFATVIAAGYISDGNDKGIRVNDFVCVIDDNLSLAQWAYVTVVTAAGLVTMIAMT